MNTFMVIDVVKRFPGDYGWYYVELDEGLSQDLRPILKQKWPALLSAEFRLNNTTWKSSIMPIKQGPLFIALPAKVRKAEKVEEGQKVSVKFNLTG